MNEVAWITTALSVLMAIVTAVSITAARVENRVSQSMAAKMTLIEKLIEEHSARLFGHDTALAVAKEHYINIEAKIDEIKQILRNHVENDKKS
jgi:hypothetical protein